MIQRLLVQLIALGLVACSGLPLNAIAPRVSVAGIEIKRLGVFEQHFDVALRVNNPNDFDLKIEALEFDLEVNGRPFASGLAPVATLIPAAASVELKVDAVMQSRNLLEQFRRVQPDVLKVGVPYRINGRIRTGQSSRWFPFDHTGVYGGFEKKPKGRAI